MLTEPECLRCELESIRPAACRGRLSAASGPVLRAQVPGAAIGDLATIERTSRRQTARPEPLFAQVIGFSGESVILSPFGPTDGLTPGARVTIESGPPTLRPGAHLLGSVVDGLGREIARLAPPPDAPEHHPSVPLEARPVDPLERTAPDEPFFTGIRAIDAFATLGVGQRLAVFAEPGVGKSTLMVSIASSSAAAVNVLGLIGERGREAAELILGGIPEHARSRTVIVASTSADPPMHRAAAASTATRIAEHFRDQGCHVLLQIDSLTRLIRAYREIGLAAGELPVRRGYPPSVFAKLPTLLERAGATRRGAVTALYTVLLSADLDEDPMVEEIKGLTDGHLMLRRAIAESGRYPAVDILRSISRLEPRLLDSETRADSATVRRFLSEFREEKELMLLGGASERAAAAFAIERELADFLTQRPEEHAAWPETRERLQALAVRIRENEEASA